MAEQSPPAPQAVPGSSSSNSLRETFRRMYPKVLERAYILPSVYFNRLSYRRELVPGLTLSTLVPRDPALSANRGSLSSAVSSQASTSPSHQSLKSASQESLSANQASLSTSQPLLWASQASTSDSRQLFTTNQPSISASQVSLADIQVTTSANEPSMSASRYSLWTDEPQPPSEPRVVQESDKQDDMANNIVFTSLQCLLESKKEVMFVLAGLKFQGYSQTFAAENLPVPEDLNESDDLTRHQEVEVDYLFIHRLYGIVIAELKSIGCPSSSNQTSNSAPDGEVGKHVKMAVEHLDRARKVLTHLVSDVGVDVTVRTTLFLPYVTSDQLRRVLANDALLLQAVCKTVGGVTADEATKLCCCHEQFDKPQHFLSAREYSVSKLKKWWERRMVMGKHSPPLSDDTYLEILARLAGPAVEVEVHCSVAPRLEVQTEGEAVAELGRRFARLVLTEVQLYHLASDDRLVYLSGPPGTGKTLVLILQALRWLLSGDDVHVLTLIPGSRAVCEMIVYQLNSMLDRLQAPVRGRVHLHCLDLKHPNTGAGLGGAELSHAQAVDRELRDLAADLAGSLTSQDRLRVIVDEAEFGIDAPLQTLVTMLRQRVPTKKLYVWAAGIFGQTPTFMQKKVLDISLRSAPAVLRQVNRGVSRLKDIRGYANVTQGRTYVPVPGDGPAVLWLDHVGPDHLTPWPATCFRCGVVVAEELRHLNVGNGGRLGLKWSDVLVLTRSSALQEEVVDDVTGRVTSEASGVVRGLRARGVPVCVLERGRQRGALEEDLRKVGQAAEDRVTVSHWNYTCGLERAVTVLLPGVIEGFDDDRSGKQIHREDMMAAASHCTTQLIIVRVRGNKLAQHFVE